MQGIINHQLNQLIEFQESIAVICNGWEDFQSYLENKNDHPCITDGIGYLECRRITIGKVFLKYYGINNMKLLNGRYRKYNRKFTKILETPEAKQNPEYEELVRSIELEE